MSQNNQDQVTCTTGEVYTVRLGDTFASVARKYGVSVRELAELNPYVDIGRLSPGQLLCVPEGESDEGDDGCPEGYTAGRVASGQTYADLLIEYDISYQAFRLSNPRLNPAALVAGQRYCVPPVGTRRICSRGAASYMIGEGETLDSLAKKLNVTPGRLLRLNPNLAPSDFAPGQQICIIEA